MPSRSCQEGDTVFVRATVLSAGSTYFQIRIDDDTTMSITTWAPASEIAKAEDIGKLRPVIRTKRFLDR